MVEQSRETPAGHRNGETVETKLLRIAAKARKERGFKFTSLYHLMNEDLLLECFRRLEGNKAAGIDEVTKSEYAENLEANIRDLVGRLHRMAYRPQPVRRVYIPKPGSDKRRCFEPNRDRHRNLHIEFYLTSHLDVVVVAWFSVRSVRQYVGEPVTVPRDSTQSGDSPGANPIQRE